MVRHITRNRQSWQRGEVGVVSVSKTGEERGTEVMPDGRKIPYSRSFNPGDYVVTTYGSHDASDHSKGISLLVKHERRGKASWGLSLNGLEMRRGKASSILQDEWGTSGANELYFAVEFVRRFPEKLKDTSTPDTAGSVIHDVILRAITTGKRDEIDLLAKCIISVDKNFAEDPFSRQTKRQKVANAICEAANRLGTIPTWQEALEEFRNAGGDYDEGNFTRALCEAGFGWILPWAEL